MVIKLKLDEKYLVYLERRGKILSFKWCEKYWDYEIKLLRDIFDVCL